MEENRWLQESKALKNGLKTMKTNMQLLEEQLVIYLGKTKGDILEELKRMYVSQIEQ